MTTIRHIGVVTDPVTGEQTTLTAATEAELDQQISDHLQGRYPLPGQRVEERTPDVGGEADGARRSARIDVQEADSPPAGQARDDALLSATRWLLPTDRPDPG